MSWGAGRRPTLSYTLVPWGTATLMLSRLQIFEGFQIQGSCGSCTHPQRPPPSHPLSGLPDTSTGILQEAFLRDTRTPILLAVVFSGLGVGRK